MTFNIVKEYLYGEAPLYHMDVYRLNESSEGVGIEDYFDKDGKMGQMFNEILSEVNPEYDFFGNKRGSIGTPLVLIQQQETHALWREFKIMKGSSANQVKPVRVLDVPMKQKFFFGLVEPGQNLPKWNVYKKNN